MTGRQQSTVGRAGRVGPDRIVSVPGSHAGKCTDSARGKWGGPAPRANRRTSGKTPRGENLAIRSINPLGAHENVSWPSLVTFGGADTEPL
jgi:hypothetical protein